MFYCDFCDYTSTSRKGVNIHKGAKHNKKSGIASDLGSTTVSSVSSSTFSFSTNAPVKPPLSCFRHDEGCPNFVTDYFDRHSAICPKCREFLDSKLNHSSFPPSICPCCHVHVGGEQFSLCSECLGSLSQDGFSESEWGFWVLNRDTGETICMQLDF